MIVRHVVFPLLLLDSNRFAITVLSTFSEFILLLCLTVLYRPQIESDIYLSGNSDDSDFVVIVSVILTQYLWLLVGLLIHRKEEPIEDAKELIVLFPGEDNYGYAQQELQIAEEDKKEFVS